MQCYTELIPPSAVTHSLSLAFLSANAQNLIVARTSLLQIFAFKHVSRTLDITTSDVVQSTNRPNGVKHEPGDDFLVESELLKSDSSTMIRLVLITEYALQGTVTSMVSIDASSTKSGGKALLIGFRDAKLSMVEWDPERYGLITTSLHFFEQDHLGTSPWATELADSVNYLSADPQSRCAALKFGSRNLAILPFRQPDDDIAMDDNWDEELDGIRPTKHARMNGDLDAFGTPYGASFVLHFSSLDPSIIYPIHLGFLFEYREPTFAILSSVVRPSLSLLNERRDPLTYMVFTLDLEQKASTTILSVSGLPYDLCRVLPLPAPVGGALLIGVNELIHVDQSGKANGVAVNAFAKQCTSFNLADQSELGLRLEGCTVDEAALSTNELLIILNTGLLYILQFKLDGRSVSGLRLRPVGRGNGGSILSSGASCLSRIGTSLFVGCMENDACVISWMKRSKHSSHKHKIEDAEDEDLILDEDDDENDDLYGDEEIVLPGLKSPDHLPESEFMFAIDDDLINLAPLRNIVCSESKEEVDVNDAHGELQLVATCGSNASGSLAILRREIEPDVIGHFEFPEARGLWTVNVQKPALGVESDQQVRPQFDRVMIVSKTQEDGAEYSSAYGVTEAGFEELTGTEFEPAAGATVEVGVIGAGAKLVQVLRSELRVYDGDLGQDQIIPMIDEETDAEPRILSASFADPYILVIRDDASIFVAQYDFKHKELEEMDREHDMLLSTKWTTGCLYIDTTRQFSSTLDGVSAVLMFLLSAEGALHVYELPDLSKAVYKADGICSLPTTVAPRFVPRRTQMKEIITEILVADLGDETAKSPYLILRAASDDLTIYEPFWTGKQDLVRDLHFHKISNPVLAKSPAVAGTENVGDAADHNRDHPMRAIAQIGGFSCVFLPGSSPAFVIKSARTIPKVIGLRGANVRALSSFHTAGCHRGFVVVDTAGAARVCRLPRDNNYDLGLPIQKINIGDSVTTIAYHLPSSIYALATSRLEAFGLPDDDDHHREWATEIIDFRPTVEQSTIHLYTPSNWSVIDSIELEAGEVVTCSMVMNLEISEHTHERKHLVVFGTAVVKGEDIAIQGRVHVYDIVDVVPEPDRPETNKKLKLIAKEIIPRGAVTAISEVGTQGFMLVAQGQKCMVRGLKEDGTLLPVAFMDMQTYVTSVKELAGTGLCVLSDALKGVWLAGYTEEPYRMILLGKQTENMQIVCAELFPIGEQLYIIAADADCNLHVLQYDPEHPKSLQGQRLLHRTTFSLGGQTPTSMTLLPRTKAAILLSGASTTTLVDAAAADTIPTHEILLTLSSGAIAILSPLSETQYRRLSTLANQLSSTLYHAGGLNPRAYRAGNGRTLPESVIGGRAVVDGGLVGRWMEVGCQRREEIVGRVGGDAEGIREDLEGLRSGLLYL